MRVFKIIGWITAGLAGAAVLGFVLGLVVMLLWNWLLPALFGLPEISYWQAVGLFVLAHLLFKGPGGPGHRGDRRWRRKCHPDGGPDHHFARKVRERLADGPPPCADLDEPATADSEPEAEAPDTGEAAVGPAAQDPPGPRADGEEDDR